MDLRAANIISAEIEGHYAHFSFVDQISTQEHWHDFYEIFLIADGSIYHHINENRVLLEAGALVFIRPHDVHYYQPNADQNCELINLAYLRHTFDDLCGFLGLDDKELLASRLPPTVTLTANEVVQLKIDLKQWAYTMYQDHNHSRIALRALLASIIVNFFIVRVEKFPNDAPWWLIDMCQRMQQKAYFVEGREALMRLANRTPEYVGRMFKTYLDMTPSQFINDLRLDYAGDLLLHTDDTITEICFEVGFENLSHFYRLFKIRWQCSPQQFRKKNRRTLIP